MTWSSGGNSPNWINPFIAQCNGDGSLCCYFSPFNIHRSNKVQPGTRHLKGLAFREDVIEWLNYFGRVKSGKREINWMIICLLIWLFNRIMMKAMNEWQLFHLKVDLALCLLMRGDHCDASRPKVLTQSHLTMQSEQNDVRMQTAAIVWEFLGDDDAPFSPDTFFKFWILCLRKGCKRTHYCVTWENTRLNGSILLPPSSFWYKRKEQNLEIRSRILNGQDSRH